MIKVSNIHSVNECTQEAKKHLIYFTGIYMFFPFTHSQKDMYTTIHFLECVK